MTASPQDTLLGCAISLASGEQERSERTRIARAIEPTIHSATAERHYQRAIPLVIALVARIVVNIDEGDDNGVRSEGAGVEVIVILIELNARVPGLVRHQPSQVGVVDLHRTEMLLLISLVEIDRGPGARENEPGRQGRNTRKDFARQECEHALSQPC